VAFTDLFTSTGLLYQLNSHFKRLFEVFFFYFFREISYNCQTGRKIYVTKVVQCWSSFNADFDLDTTTQPSLLLLCYWPALESNALERKYFERIAGYDDNMNMLLKLIAMKASWMFSTVGRNIDKQSVFYQIICHQGIGRVLGVRATFLSCFGLLYYHSS